MTSLRPYQRAAIDAILDYWAKGGANPLIDMATGVGKSVVLASLIKELLEQFPQLRIVVLVHVKELVAQDAKALMRLWPQADIGINSAGLGRRDRRNQILFASIQSIYRDTAQTIGPRDLILIDEAHLVPKSGFGMYRTFIEAMQEDVPDLRVGGTSATCFRMGEGRLDEGNDRLFSEVVYTYGIGEAIQDGYLSPLSSPATATKIDVSDVAKRGGEFVAGALEAAVDKDWITRAATDEIIASGHNRKSWLLFCSGVQHALHMRDEVRSRGITCETVTGETPNGERDRIVKAFAEGRIRCLTNANVLTTGFDVPGVDLIGMLRPTLSTGLYLQICGRGTRPVYPPGFVPDATDAAGRRLAIASGPKPDCLVLDFAGNVRRHGPVDAINPRGSGFKAEVAVKEDSVRAKECPGCKEQVALNTRVCQHCGHEWPRDETPKHDARADAERPIMSTGAVSNWLEVSETRFFRHAKIGSPTSMRVEYTCGLGVPYRQWVCFEHDGFARQKAESWWRRMGMGPCPKTVAEAIERQNEIMPAAEIQVRPSGQYFEVVAVRALALEAAE